MTTTSIGLSYGTLWRRFSVANNQARYYRKVAQTVLRWYSELEDGVIQGDAGPVFDARILEYRVDVELALKEFDPRELLAVILVNRDGLTHAQAVTIAGIPTDRPDRTVKDIEVNMGRAFDRRRLGDFLGYIDYLR